MLAAQVTHAAGYSVQFSLPANTHAVVLEAQNEQHLLDVRVQLQIAEIPHELIEEIDPPYAGQAMAIGIHPIEDRTSIQKILSYLPLLKGSPVHYGRGESSGSPPCPGSSVVER